MKDEIVAGIKNALERGESVDEAMQSLINAGYKTVEVREAANSLTGGTTPLMHPEATVQPMLTAAPVNSEAPSQPARPPAPAFSLPPAPVQAVSAAQGASGKKKIIFLVALLLVLVGILIVSILYKDKILAAFS